MITSVEISLIDNFVMLDRQLKALKVAHDKARENIVKHLGEGRHESGNYAVTVSLSQRNTVDYKTIMAAYNVPAETVEANTTRTAVITVKAGA